MIKVFCKPYQGFTLMEILIVVVIISIMTLAGVRLLGMDSEEKETSRYIQRFHSKIKLACEQSVFRNRKYGVLFSQDGYSFVYFTGLDWKPVESNSLLSTDILPHNAKQEIYRQGRQMQLSKDLSEKPQVYCSVDGSYSVFRLVLKVRDLSYQLMTESPWKLTGEWLDK